MAKKINFFILLSFILSLILSSCKESKKFSGDTVEVISEDIPKNPSFSIKFKEKLSISREDWFPSSLIVDEEENIYIFDNMLTIYKYSKKGELILKKELKKGEGPGEFMQPEPFYSSTGKIYLYDKLLRRLTILNKQFGVEKIMKFTEPGFVFQADSNGNFFLLRYKKLHPDYGEKLLTKFNPDGKPILEIFKYLEKRAIEIKGKTHLILYSPYMIYKLDKKDNVYFAISDKYEIGVISPEGKLLRKIKKNTKPRRITKKDFERIRGKDIKGIKIEYTAPDYFPFICDFLLLDNGFLLVLTYEYDDGKHDTILTDVFDENGIFLNHIEVPKYHLCYFYVDYFKKGALYYKNSFYIIELDKEEENLYVKKYDMIF